MHAQSPLDTDMHARSPRAEGVHIRQIMIVHATSDMYHICDV